MRPVVHLVGRFPPPYDGQSLATRRLARMLRQAFDVRTVDTALKDQSLAPSGFRPQLHTVQHYLQLRTALRRSLATAPDAPVLWGGISPTPLGHARDAIATLPCIPPAQRVVAIAHRGHFDRIFRSRLTRWSAARMAQRVEKFVFLSEYLASQVAPWIPEARCTIIPYSVEPCASAEEAAEKQRARRRDAPLKLLYLSNMIPSKGYLDVLEAIAQVHAQGQAVAATFAGRWNNDRDRTHFHQRVWTLRLESVVTHHGAVRDRNEINALHREAEVFLLPSYYSEEAQPISIIEALSAATPVIVTRHSGIRDMVRTGKEARFVPARSPASIAEAITALADVSKWLEASRHARKRYQQQFGEEAVRTRWMALLAAFI